MTDEEYLEHNAQVCPYCHSKNISGSNFESDGTSAWQEVSCEDCHEEWLDIYKLTGFTPKS